MTLNNVVGCAVGSADVESMTLHIDANLIKLSHKEFEIDFELDPRRLENIDTIVINGYKYVKPKE